MKKTRLFWTLAAIALMGVAVFAGCEKDDSVMNDSNPALDKNNVELWRCYGKYYEYIGNGSDTNTSEDPVNNPSYREHPDTLFKITFKVLKNQNLIFSQIENYRNISLSFADSLWYRYDTITHANTNMIFHLLSAGRDTTNMTNLNAQYSFSILRFAADTVSFRHNYTGPWVGGTIPFNFYMFIKERNN